MKHKTMKSKHGVILFLILGLILLIVQGYRLLDSSDHRLKDFRYQTGGLVSPEIYVVGIDEETLEAFGPWQTWSREKMAEVIRLFNQDPAMAPAVIGLDIGFFGETGESADEALAEAAALYDNIVSTSYVTFGKEISTGADGQFTAEHTIMTYETPYDRLSESIIWGFNNMPVDEDGMVRHTINYIDMPERDTGESRIYSFAAEIYRKYMGELPAGIDETPASYIPFSGYPYDYYGSETAGISFSKVLSGEIPAEMFAGTIVLIGPYSAGMMDSYYTAISHDTPMFGVEVHANILQAFLESNMKTDLSQKHALMITAGMMILMFLILNTGNLVISTVFAALLMGIYWLLAGVLYNRGLVVPMLYPLAAVGVFYISHIGLRYVQEYREKRHIQQVFGKYVSDDVVANIIKGGEDALKLGGQKRDVAVLFVDIRGFTPLSEALEPERVVEILNRYLALTTKAVFDNGGTVDKFIGDATMALFNAPLDLDDYVYRAVKTGLDMAAAAKSMEADLAAITDRTVGFGIGVNCGEAVIGNIGTSSRMDYTAIGSTVNTAARLESRAKSGEVLINEDVYQRLKGRIMVTSLGKQTLKGIAEEVEIYRVDGLMEP